jgi:hypothetical protein
MRRALGCGLALALLGAAGCDSRGFIKVTVANLPPGADRIDVSVIEGAQHAGPDPIALDGASNTFDFSLSFASDRSGLVEVTVDARRGGAIVAQGSGSANLVPGKVGDVTIVLPGPPPPDLGPAPPDLAGLDFTTLPDLQAPPPFDNTGLKAWFRADHGVSTTPNTTNVFQWEDSSGFTHHASQPTVNNQPSLAMNVVNGMPAVRFTGGQTLFFDAGYLIGTNYSLVIVEARSKANTGFIFAGGTFTKNEGLGIAYSDTSTLRLSQWNNDLDMVIPAFTTPQFAISTGVFDQAKGHALYRTGQAAVMNMEMTPVAGTALDKIYIGAVLIYNYTGDVAELMVFDVAISDAQRTGIESYLKQKYGL